MPGKIHACDIATILKAVVLGIVLETILLAPTIPTKLFRWGHAGPGTIPGLVGVSGQGRNPLHDQRFSY